MTGSCAYVNQPGVTINNSPKTISTAAPVKYLTGFDLFTGMIVEFMLDGCWLLIAGYW